MLTRGENLTIPDLLSGAGTAFELLKTFAHIAKNAGGSEEELLRLLESNDWRLRHQISRLLVQKPGELFVVADVYQQTFRMLQYIGERRNLLYKLGVTRDKIRVDLSDYFPERKKSDASPPVLRVRLQPITPQLEENQKVRGIWPTKVFRQGVMKELIRRSLRLLTFDEFLAFGTQHWWLVEQIGLEYPHEELNIYLYASSIGDRTIRIEQAPEGGGYQGLGAMLCLVHAD